MPCRRPGRRPSDPPVTCPLGIIGSLAIATVIYILVAVVATGLLPAPELAKNADAALAAGLQQGGGFSFGADLVAVGALVAITSVVLTILYGQTRITFAMCRDGLLPQGLARLTRRRTPWLITLIRSARRRLRRLHPAHRAGRAGQHRHAVRIHPRQ